MKHKITLKSRQEIEGAPKINQFFTDKEERLYQFVRVTASSAAFIDVSTGHRYNDPKNEDHFSCLPSGFKRYRGKIEIEAV